VKEHSVPETGCFCHRVKGCGVTYLIGSFRRRKIRFLDSINQSFHSGIRILSAVDKKIYIKIVKICARLETKTEKEVENKPSKQNPQTSTQKKMET
jgi:hypothetical protein